MIDDDAWVQALMADYRTANLTEADRAMLDYATKLTREPWSVDAGDVESMRKAGLDDAAILDVNQVAGYFAFVNRLADGLGVALEPFWDEPRDNAPEA